jgi:hypothetical protein
MTTVVKFIATSPLVKFIAISPLWLNFCIIINLTWLPQVYSEEKKGARLIAQNHNVSEWSDISIHRLLFEYSSTIKIQHKHVVLVQSGNHHHHLILSYNLLKVLSMLCEIKSRSWWDVLDTTLCDQVFQWLATGQWFSLGIPVMLSEQVIVV